jgi:hypothetical protein
MVGERDSWHDDEKNVEAFVVVANDLQRLSNSVNGNLTTKVHRRKGDENALTRGQFVSAHSNTAILATRIYLQGRKKK